MPIEHAGKALRPHDSELSAQPQPAAKGKKRTLTQSEAAQGGQGAAAQFEPAPKRRRQRRAASPEPTLKQPAAGPRLASSPSSRASDQTTVPLLRPLPSEQEWRAFLQSWPDGSAPVAEGQGTGLAPPGEGAPGAAYALPSPELTLQLPHAPSLQLPELLPPVVPSFSLEPGAVVSPFAGLTRLTDNDVQGMAALDLETTMNPVPSIDLQAALQSLGSLDWMDVDHPESADGTPSLWSALPQPVQEAPPSHPVTPANCPRPRMAEEVMDALAAHLKVPFTRYPGNATALAPSQCPSREQLSALVNAFRGHQAAQYDCYEDRCNYRAHVFAGMLRKAGFDCHKLFVHGDLRTSTPEGEVRWVYHVAPLVYLHEAGAVRSVVVDLSLFPEGPVAPTEWAAAFYNNKAVEAEITEATTRDPAHYCYKPGLSAPPKRGKAYSFESAQRHLDSHYAGARNAADALLELLGLEPSTGPRSPALPPLQMKDLT